MRAFGINRAVLLGLTAMLTPAIAGAIFGWPWWVVYATMLPSAVWLIDGGRFFGIIVNRQWNAVKNRALLSAQILPLVIIATIYTSRFSGLLVFTGFAIAYIAAWLRGPH